MHVPIPSRTPCVKVKCQSSLLKLARINATPNIHPPAIITACGEYSLAHTIVNGPPIDIRAIAKVPIRFMRAVLVPVKGVLGCWAISSYRDCHTPKVKIRAQVVNMTRKPEAATMTYRLSPIIISYIVCAKHGVKMGQKSTISYA